MKKILAESLHEYVNTIKDRNYVSTTTDDYKYEQSIEDDRGSIINPKTEETSAERQLIDAPIGSKASGGGYDGWEKISNNGWRNSKINKLLHSYALAAHIGVFNDFVIIQPEVVKSKNDPKIKTEETSAERQLIDAPIGSKASGGGYDGWEKISNTTWYNSITKRLVKSDILATQIGGFADFFIDQPGVCHRCNRKIT